jgi:hypothetical protein
MEKMEETLKGDDDEGGYSPAASSIKKPPMKYEANMQYNKPPLAIRHIMHARVSRFDKNRNTIDPLRKLNSHEKVIYCRRMKASQAIDSFTMTEVTRSLQDTTF